ncbi:MAG: T9SS type A sorting domain-containing protein [bacterium]|nr:T9SS type A sorting domain-containing protein [bacterium]
MKKTLIMLLALATVFSSLAFGQYNQNWLRFHNDSLGHKVRQGTHIEWQRAVTAGNNGTWYFAWTSTKWGFRGLYLGKIDANGNILWTITVNDGPSRQEDPVLQDLADGSVVVAWVDYRHDAGGSIFAQRVSPNGQLMWSNDTINAVLVANAPRYQNDLRILRDGSDGVLIFWEDSRYNLGFDIFASRLLGNGQLAPGWRPNGTPVVATAGNQPDGNQYTVDVDAYGGAWVAWVDSRNPANRDIYIQQIRANGTTRWDSTGHALITAPNEQSRIKLAPDGRGGAFLVWRHVTLTNTVDLYVQRIDSTGTPLWTPNNVGVALCDATGEQTNPRIIFSSNDHAIISWEDFRNDPGGNSNEDLFVNKITGTTSLTKLWGAQGTAATLNTEHQRESRLTSDGVGGCVLVWEDERNGGFVPNQQVYAQRFNSTGSPVWTTDGTVVTERPAGQFAPICRESGGRLLFMWGDMREGSRSIYRSVWNLNGTPVLQPFDGTLTVSDIAGNVSKNHILCNETGRAIHVWVDNRRMVFGNRIYYSINDVFTGNYINTVDNGNPITLDSTNFVKQDGSDNNNNYVVVPTPAPDLGAIIVYFNTSNQSTSFRGQKIDRNGNRQWGNFGVPLSDALESPDFLSGVPNYSNGGVYFAYTMSNLTTFFNELWFQSIDGNGNRLLGNNGVVLSNNRDNSFVSMTESNGNLYVGFIEFTVPHYSVIVKKVSSQGNVLWTTVVADSVSPNYETGPTGGRQQLKLIPAQNGGVVAIWREVRWDAGNGGQIFAQKLNSDGVVQWTRGGIQVGNSTEDQSRPNGFYTGSSYWIGWEDARHGGIVSIYVQHIAENGQKLLAPNGQRLFPSTNAQRDVAFSRDGSNGAFPIFSSYLRYLNEFPPPDTLEDSDIMATHLRANGTIADLSTWNNNLGYLVRTYANQQTPSVAYNQNWRSVLTNWQDMRATGKEELIDLYFQHFADSTSVSVQEEPIISLPIDYELSQNWPNPFNSTTTFRFKIPNNERVRIVLYDLQGREVMTLIDETKNAGSYLVSWNGRNQQGVKVSSGIYFYQLTAGTKQITKKLSLLN